jgi:formate dehydrogenase gamma subunit
VFGDLDDRDGQVARHFRTHRVERLETSAVAVQPNVYYSGRKDVLERIRLSHPPRPAGLHPPLPGRLLRDLLKPAFMAMLALGALGVAATFLRQLLRGEGDDASGHGGAEAGPEVGEVHRHDAVILWLHWFNALAWLFQASTGFALLGRTAYSVTPPFFNDAMLSVFGSGATMLRAHIVVGLIWAVVLVMYGVFGFKRYLVPFLAGLRLRPDDLRWIRTRSGNIFRRSEQPLPPQDKYNAGQKLCGMAVSLGTFVVASTGLVLYFLPGSGAIVQWAIPLHFAAAAGVVLAILIHVTVVTLLPAERPALWSMFTGKISSRYAREHNARWWNGLKDK